MKRTLLAFSLIAFFLITSSSVSAALSVQRNPVNPQVTVAAVLVLQTLTPSTFDAMPTVVVDSFQSTELVKDHKKLKVPFVSSKNKPQENNFNGQKKPNHKKTGTGFDSPANRKNR